jgi:hypothetical protein
MNACYVFYHWDKVICRTNVFLLANYGCGFDKIFPKLDLYCWEKGKKNYATLLFLRLLSLMIVSPKKKKLIDFVDVHGEN